MGGTEVTSAPEGGVIGSSDNLGHDKNNPSGQKAKEEEDKARSGYNSASKKNKKKE